jgi:branched-chain amino acid transport system substrate-binding protein
MGLAQAETGQIGGTNMSAARKAAMLIIAALAPIILASSLASAELPAIKIGVLASLSGVLAIVGERISQGVTLAVDEINADGGILGRKVEAIIRDDETNPDSAVRLTRRLVQQESVLAIFGPNHGGAAIAVGNEARKMKTPFFPWAATEEMNTTNCGRYVWRVGGNAQQTSRSGAVMAERLGLTKWATVSSDYSYGRSVVNQFTGYLKELQPQTNLIYQGWPKLGEEDYSPYISNISKAKPEAVYVGLYGADVVKFLRQARAFGLLDQVKVFTDSGANQVVLDALDQEAPFGHWASARYLPNFPDTAANRDFVRRFRERFKALPDMAAEEAYAAVMVFAEATRRAGVAEKEKIIDSLSALAYNSPKGWVVMRPSDHQGWQSSFWGIVGKNESGAPVLTKVQTISPVQAEFPDESSGQGCKQN